VTGLRADLDAMLAAPNLAHGTWGVVVRSLRTRETLYAHNNQKLLMPASTMKIVTLAAAGTRLGWDFRYDTELYASGMIANGTLDGDLIVVGSGDPSLMAGDGTGASVFSTWADRLQQLGVRTVAGRIIGDDRAFEQRELGFGWSWDDLADDYAAGVGALQYNENAVRVIVTPGPAPGDPGGVSVEPAGAGILVLNGVTTSVAGALPALEADRLPGSRTLRLSGTIPQGAHASALDASVDNPTLFFVESLRRALIERGLDVRGEAADVDDLHPAPPLARSLKVATHQSPPLSALAVRLMKVSQNQYAETFLKTLALHTSAGGQATAAAARDLAQQLFEAWGVDGGSLIQRDGSGLSRYDYVTAEALATILVHLYEDPAARGPFTASLPVVGDGTLANRLKGTAADGRLRAKTGSMSNVRAMAGYVDTADAEPLVFAIIANNFDSPPDVINGATDAMVVRLAEFSR
jgi:D-alanyl-D-alanine carboxypeptidase/D-alanyl-D-alanine-endopeptidase (penicillin-binding protein 4)